MFIKIENLETISLNNLEIYIKDCQQELYRRARVVSNNTLNEKKGHLLSLLFGQIDEYIKAIKQKERKQASAIQPRQPPV